MDDSFKFSLSYEPLSMHNCTDYAVWTQNKTKILERVVSDLA